MTDKAIGLALSDNEVVPARAMVDGFILPVLLDVPAFWPALDTARMAYSTRYQPVGELGDPFLENAAQFVRERQTQRSVRVRNADWEALWPQLLPGLQGGLVEWATATRQPLTSPGLEPFLRLLGLDMGSHRRVQLLRSLAEAGIFTEHKGKVFGLDARCSERSTAVCPWAPLFLGLNQVVPAVYQGFNQVTGATLSWRSLRQRPERLSQLHTELVRQMEGDCRHLAVPFAEGSRASQRHVVLTTFQTLSQMEGPRHLSSDLGLAERLMLWGPVAELMRRLGPRVVANRVIRRRFIERIEIDTGLSGVELYEFVARRYQIRSANSVRAFLQGPALLRAGAEPSFNRGVVNQLAYVVRVVLAQAGREGLAERHLRERISKQHSVPRFDIGVWQGALGVLEEDDIIRRYPCPTGSAFALRSEEAVMSVADLEQMEAGVKLVLGRLPRIVAALAANEPTAHVETRMWCIPRAKLGEMRQLVLACVDHLVNEAEEPNHGLTESEEQQQGMTLGEILLTTRVLPLLSG